MSNYASIDTGSNTLRLLIASINSDIKIKDVYYDRRVTRLGAGVDIEKKISKENFELSLSAFKDFSKAISKYGVVKTIAFGTSALREALNADEFIKKVDEVTGIKIKVIPGEKEAELTLNGIILSFPEDILREQELLIVDIGGGSTEIIYLKNKKPVFIKSIPLGVIKLVNKFLKSDPPNESEIDDMINEMDKYLNDLKNNMKSMLNNRFIFVGTAGTFSTIASIDLMLEEYDREKIHLHKVPYERLKKMRDNLVYLTLEERKKVKGLEPERADIIVPGLYLTVKVMELFDIKELVISDYGILEGALLELYEEDLRGNT